MGQFIKSPVFLLNLQVFVVHLQVFTSLRLASLTCAFLCYILGRIINSSHPNLALFRGFFGKNKTVQYWSPHPSHHSMKVTSWVRQKLHTSARSFQRHNESWSCPPYVKLYPTILKLVVVSPLTFVKKDRDVWLRSVGILGSTSRRKCDHRQLIIECLEKGRIHSSKSRTEFSASPQSVIALGSNI